MKQKELNSPLGSWRYLASQEGSKALLFIHGANSSRNAWHHQFDLAISGYQNLFVDLLGYGDSDKPLSGYSLPNWIQGLRDILTQEAVQEVCIVAHSNGVIFAKEFYRAHPQMVRHMILIDGMLKQMLQPPMLQWMKSTLEREDYEEFMAQNIQRMPVQGLSEKDIAVLKNDSLNMPKYVSMAEFDMVSDPATWAEIRIDCPTTIIHSGRPFLNEEYVQWLPQISPNHQFYKWLDAGHFIQMQHAQRLNQLIQAQISGI